jgi:hypothetical protein
LVVTTSRWDNIGIPEGLKKIILGTIAGGVVFMVFCGMADFLSGVGDHILSALNKTGFTIPASANYVASIESLASSACLIPRTVSGLLVLIGIIVALVTATIVTIETLLKRYDSLTA